MVRKSDLLSAVWPDSFVEEGILAVHISHLRRALGGRQYIETVARSGYRWASDVAARRLCPVHTSEVHELLGRGRTHLLAVSMSDAPKAVAAFQAAIASDPNYAAAYAGLALAWCAQAVRLINRPRQQRSLHLLWIHYAPMPRLHSESCSF